MSPSDKRALASLDALYRIFTIPEAPGSTLARIDREISANVAQFLQEHIVATDRDIVDIEADFADPHIPDTPIFVSEQTEFLLDKIVAQSVHTASPSFVGHMASALPYFMLPLSKIMIALNQNLVKTETSKAFTPLERQVLGQLHGLVYERDENFYAKWMHDGGHALGAFGSGGTVANITALWVARNKAFPPRNGFRGVHQAGLFAALHEYDCQGAAILVSQRGQYSLNKAADVLGIGREQLIAVDTDSNNRVRPEALRRECERLADAGIKPMAIVGIAGTTETGSVDPLDELADVATEFGCHFHVDSAWGGPTLFSDKYRYLLKGIERADSVTLDAHKQLYVPMGAGLVLFRDPTALGAIEHHANYVIRPGSKDLGSMTLEGSRPGMAMLVHSGLRIIAREGYELLINQGIEKAKKFARMIEESPYFELISEPELNILTYRLVPADSWAAINKSDEENQREANSLLNELTRFIQKKQRGAGRSFVSRTRLTPKRYGGDSITVFRVVLANPLTTTEILADMLEEQREIATHSDAAAHINRLREIAAQVQSDNQLAS